MKAAVLRQPGVLTIEDVTRSDPAPQEVVVQIAAAEVPSPAQVVQGILRRQPEFAPEPVRDQAIETRAFVNFIEMGNGIQLRATWFDHDNLLAGAIVTQEDAIPLPDQRLGALRGSKWVDFQTREQACAALAKDAIQMVEKIDKAAQ